MDFEGSINPNHTEINLSTGCINCHSTEPDWMPATFDIHDDYYPLEGAHAMIANDCATCHNGDYNNTPNTCIGCHLDDFNSTTDPNHAAANFSTDCTQCHTQDVWEPSTFDHDAQHFPIYSGAHEGEWNDWKFHGQGTMTFPDGGRYVGEFKNDKKHGQGTYTFSDGRKYVGEFKDGKSHGQGTFTCLDGTKYDGE